MCFTIEQVAFIVALAILSGSDWEHMARKAIKQRLGLDTQPPAENPPPTTNNKTPNNNTDERQNR